MPKKISIVNAILCEYVGNGNNNKHILVNTFSGDIIAGSLPATLGFGLYIEIARTAKNEMVKQLEIEFRLGDQPIFAAGSDMSNGATVFVVPLFQVRIEGPTTLEVALRSAGFGETVAIRKSVLLNDPSPIASPPPSSQSPPDAPAS